LIEYSVLINDKRAQGKESDADALKQTGVAKDWKFELVTEMSEEIDH